MKKLTTRKVLNFAKSIAGRQLLTLRDKKVFTVEVISERIVCFPSSGTPYWVTLEEYVPIFNRTKSFSPRAYPKRLWSNSYWVSIADAIVHGTKPLPLKKRENARDEEPELPSKKLEAKVRRLRKTISRAPKGQKRPRKVKVVTIQTVRDPAIKAWILKTAQGMCGLCEKPAPFKDSYGLPYLEVHHVRPLAEGGADTISNAIALCPNCHAACHYSANRTHETDKLYVRYPRLAR